MDFDGVCTLASTLPDVEASRTQRGPSLRVRGKLLACPAIHRSAEPDSLVVKIGFAERAQLLSESPDFYYVTDHYRAYPSILVRLSKIDRGSLQSLLQKAWRFMCEEGARGGGRSGGGRPRRTRANSGA